MSPLIPIVVQLIVEDPAGRILLAKDHYDESQFEYLETRLEYGSSLESTARRLLSSVSNGLDYPTLEFFGLYNGSVAMYLYVVFRQKLDQEMLLPDPPEGISDWRWFEPVKIKGNKKIAPPVRHDCGEIIGPLGDEYEVRGKRPQWPQQAKTA